VEEPPTYVKRIQATLSFKSTLRPRLLRRVLTYVASLVPSRPKATEIHPHTSPSILEAAPMLAALSVGAAILAIRRARRRLQ
jgi:hypothetical protein